eukprot:284816846_5
MQYIAIIRGGSPWAEADRQAPTVAYPRYHSRVWRPRATGETSRLHLLRPGSEDHWWLERPSGLPGFGSGEDAAVFHWLLFSNGSSRQFWPGQLCRSYGARWPHCLPPSGSCGHQHSVVCMDARHGSFEAAVAQGRNERNYQRRWMSCDKRPRLEAASSPSRPLPVVYLAKLPRPLSLQPAASLSRCEGRVCNTQQAVLDDDTRGGGSVYPQDRVPNCCRSAWCRQAPRNGCSFTRTRNRLSGRCRIQEFPDAQTRHQAFCYNAVLPHPGRNLCHGYSADDDAHGCLERPDSRQEGCAEFADTVSQNDVGFKTLRAQKLDQTILDDECARLSIKGIRDWDFFFLEGEQRLQDRIRKQALLHCDFVTFLECPAENRFLLEQLSAHANVLGTLASEHEDNFSFYFFFSLISLAHFDFQHMVCSTKPETADTTDQNLLARTQRDGILRRNFHIEAFQVDVGIQLSEMEIRRNDTLVEAQYALQDTQDSRRALEMSTVRFACSEVQRHLTLPAKNGLKRSHFNRVSKRCPSTVGLKEVDVRGQKPRGLQSVSENVLLWPVRSGKTGSAIMVDGRAANKAQHMNSRLSFLLRNYHNCTTTFATGVSICTGIERATTTTRRQHSGFACYEGLRGKHHVHTTNEGTLRISHLQEVHRNVEGRQRRGTGGIDRIARPLSVDIRQSIGQQRARASSAAVAAAHFSISCYTSEMPIKVAAADNYREILSCQLRSRVACVSQSETSYFKHYALLWIHRVNFRRWKREVCACKHLGILNERRFVRVMESFLVGIWVVYQVVIPAWRHVDHAIFPLFEHRPEISEGVAVPGHTTSRTDDGVPHSCHRDGPRSWIEYRACLGASNCEDLGFQIFIYISQGGVVKQRCSR